MSNKDDECNKRQQVVITTCTHTYYIDGERKNRRWIKNENGFVQSEIKPIMLTIML